MKFDLIVSDPPWAFGDRLQKMKKRTRRSAVSQYNTMTVDEIAALNVRDLANPMHSVLALWVPSTLLPQGFQVMNAWGFTFKQTFVWVKSKKNLDKEIKKAIKAGRQIDLNDLLAFGMGRLFRQAHEIALIGTIGKVYDDLDNHSQRSVILDPNEGHSIKPKRLQDRLDVMFPNAQKLEMFARRERPGWEVIGDGVTGKDIRISIQELLTL